MEEVRELLRLEVELSLKHEEFRSNQNELNQLNEKLVSSVRFRYGYTTKEEISEIENKINKTTNKNKEIYLEFTKKKNQLEKIYKILKNNYRLEKVNLELQQKLLNYLDIQSEFDKIINTFKPEGNLSEKIVLLGKISLNLDNIKIILDNNKKFNDIFIDQYVINAYNESVNKAIN